MPRNVCAQHPRPVAQHEPRVVREAPPGMCRTFIQRSARQRRNSISSAVEVLGPHHRRRAVVLLDVVVDDQAALAEVASSSACPDTASDAGCTASRRSAARTRGWPRSTRACRPGCRRSGRRRRSMPWRWRMLDRARCVALPTVRPALALRVLRAAPSGTPGPRRGRSRCRGTRSGTRPAASAAPASSPCVGDRRGHRLHDVVDVVEARRR